MLFARIVALLILSGTVLGLTSAQAATPAEAVKMRGDGLVALLNGKAVPASQFTPEFLAAVPAAQVTAIGDQLRVQFGAAERVAAIRPEGDYAAAVDFAYRRGTVTMRMVVDARPPHLVSGLLVTGSKLNGDSAAALEADFRVLSGAGGFAIVRLDGAAPATVAHHNGDRSFAIGSGFKLYVLAELLRAVNAGERKWDAVVPLTERSLPSGALRDWPPGSPITLHSLAAMMISTSDNSATDQLIAVLGREKIEAMVAAAGHSNAARNRPFLTTGELFLLKGRAGAPYLARWMAGDADARRAILDNDLRKIDRGRFDYGSFTGLPKAIDSVEWFATPLDVARVLDWIRRNDTGPGGPARRILAINAGLGDARRDHAYVGFKGGSEAGVIGLNYLVQSKAGAWYAVTGSWNDPNAAVEALRFTGLMSRAVALAAK